jgi:hypothetical protein
MQNFKPSPSSDAVPGGTCAVVHKLWKAMLLGRVWHGLGDIAPNVLVVFSHADFVASARKPNARCEV